MENKEIIHTIQSIYDSYAIPLSLRKHMIHVAAVAEILADNCTQPVDTELIVAAALIHDLGNFIKMQFAEEHLNIFHAEDISKIAFFKEKQKEFTKKYGEKTYLANIAIAKEIGASKRIQDIIKADLFHHFTDLGTLPLEDKIFGYADLRVTPYGITSMEERTAEYSKRYKLEQKPEKLEHSKKFMQYAQGLEDDIFSHMKIRPEDITEKSCKKYITQYAPRAGLGKLVE